MKKELFSIGETSHLLGVSIDTLRRWDKNGQLPSFRPAPTSHRYYHRKDIESFLGKTQFLQAKNWLSAENSRTPEDIFYCETRDVFQVRLTHMQTDLARISGLENLSSLIAAIAGEIGNNSFDHNIGNWPSTPGIFFGYDTSRREIILADRGQGILQTIKRVKPRVNNHKEALHIAFTEIISGRAPEARGNGLKFVKNIVMQNPLRLLFQTGNAILHLKQGDKRLHIRVAKMTLRGCLVMIQL